MYNTIQIGSRLNSMFDLSGKIVLITGAGQGLGALTAHLFAEVGAQVVVADRNLEAAEAVTAEIKVAGGLAVAAMVDVAEQASVSALFTALDNQFERIDVLVNNAANRAKAEFFNMTVEQWDVMQEVTLRGTFLCCREAIRRMIIKKAGGAIVNVSSVGSVHPTLWGVNAHYDAAKAGVDSLTRSLASEFASDRVRVNSVLPGGMKSEGAARITDTYHIRGPMTGAARIPLGRVADPLEVASVILFLGSSAASYVTGQILAADGGYMVS